MRSRRELKRAIVAALAANEDAADGDRLSVDEICNTIKRHNNITASVAALKPILIDLNISGHIFWQRGKYGCTEIGRRVWLGQGIPKEVETDNQLHAMAIFGDPEAAEELWKQQERKAQLDAELTYRVAVKVLLLEMIRFAEGEATRTDYETAKARAAEERKAAQKLGCVTGEADRLHKSYSSYWSDVAEVRRKVALFESEKLQYIS